MFDKFSFRFNPFRVVLLISMLVAPSQIAQAQQMAIAVKKGTFNYLRVAPNHRAQIIRKLRQGTEFEVIGETGNYFNLRLADGMTGWLHYSNVRFK